MGDAWRVGGTVHRPVGRQTPAVHALLGFLAPRFEHTPSARVRQQSRKALDAG